MATRYLTTGEVALALGVSETSVKRWIAGGQLPSRLIGGMRRVTQEALREFVNRHKQARRQTKPKTVRRRVQCPHCKQIMVVEIAEEARRDKVRLPMRPATD